jgi:hypothetical protein
MRIELSSMNKFKFNNLKLNNNNNNTKKIVKSLARPAPGRANDSASHESEEPPPGPASKNTAAATRSSDPRFQSGTVREWCPST